MSTQSSFPQFFKDYATQVKQMLDFVDVEDLQRAVEMVKACQHRGGTVWLCGNGGSAALASHMAVDLQLAGLRAMALTDVAALTTIANDKRYVDVFKEQLKVMAKPEDLLIAISGSGNSVNIATALLEARVLGMEVLFLSGFDGGHIAKVIAKSKLLSEGFLHLNMPAMQMGVAQDGHQIALHIVCYYLMTVRGVPSGSV